MKESSWPGFVTITEKKRERGEPPTVEFVSTKSDQLDLKAAEFAAVLAIFLFLIIYIFYF